MNTSALKPGALLLAIMMMVTGCSSTQYARNWNGLSSPDGKAISHLSTSNVALHLFLGSKPWVGNASLDKTVDDFTAAAKAEGASKVRIDQSSKTNWWFIFFPFTLLVTPVTSNVAGEAIS